MYVSDVATTVAFYEEHGIAKLVSRPAHHIAIMSVGEMMLYIHEDPEEFKGNLAGFEREKLRGRGIIIHVPVDDIDAWSQKFSGKGQNISLGPITQAHGHRETYFYDPDGYNFVVFSKI